MFIFKFCAIYLFFRVSLKEFQKFGSMTEALAATTALLEGSMDKTLENFIQKSIVQKGVQARLAVMDKTLGKAISDKFNIDVVNNNNVMELFRCIRSQLEVISSYSSSFLYLCHRDFYPITWLLRILIK